MKKLLSMVLIFVFICGFMTVNAEVKPEASGYVVVKASLPENIDDRDSWKARLRFKDGEPITLSAFYDGYVFGTIPAEYAGRDVEAFIPDEIKFSDDDESRFEFFTMERLSQTGVIKGNEKGEAKPFDNVTRAEAAAMVRRFLNLPLMEDGDTSFEDVEKSDWFFGEVLSVGCGYRIWLRQRDARY